MSPILKIDARTQIEAAPDEQTEQRCRSANQSLITDVFALRPYFCTIQLQPIRTAMQCGARLLRPPPLTGDIRSYGPYPIAFAPWRFRSRMGIQSNVNDREPKDEVAPSPA